jgi:cell division protein FtsN
VVTAPPAADTPPPPAAENVVATPPAPAEAGRYTVQVGSYNVRAQADALRSRLASSGHEAYIAEGEAGGVTRYRVRIGTFTSAEDARQAAVRLASQARVATYVTTR